LAVVVVVVLALAATAASTAAIARIETDEGTAADDRPWMLIGGR
jgi:hypothetical protein